ncbi:hypothetical protein INR76_06475 [Marixanthomonas sp. SCSIO 43207]|uniref:DUF5074 domain-containing protein n=1 Tax=Marixanthomonas sp. SCSIO 43207 TaxID=2779360 RepID=UPI001CA8E6DC|nr:hypothetical protein [Marixanthomonas sp. SCSIO 43207]UAB82401.1 hypothetical protein INR76_06475 [Marixanthomonas sp. SCSIO 43207]
MKNRIYIIFITIISILFYGCKQNIKVHSKSFYGINPLSYTDVIFKSSRDTVLASTFSGRIVERIKDHNKENILINLNDEIYSLVYDQKKQHIYASTLNSGILVIDSNKKMIIDSLNIEGTWISNIFLSKDGELLAGSTANHKNCIWDLKNKTSIKLPDSLSHYMVAGIDNTGNVIINAKEKFIFWDVKEDSIKKENIRNGKLESIDKSGNLLVFQDKYFQYYKANKDSASFKSYHQDWPYYWKEKDTLIRIPFQLTLTAGILTDKYIYTAGVDRSIRKWNKQNGQLKEEIIKHRATISAIDLSFDQLQVVSVDLKGGVLFHDVEKK